MNHTNIAEDKKKTQRNTQTMVKFISSQITIISKLYSLGIYTQTGGKTVKEGGEVFALKP